MTYHPILRTESQPPVPRPSVVQAVRQQRALQRHAAEAELTTRKGLIDILASGQVAAAGLQAELALLAYGRGIAGNDPGADHLVASKVAHFAEANNARFLRDWAPRQW